MPPGLSENGVLASLDLKEIPNNQGFDEFFGYNCQRQAHRYYPSHLWHNQEKVILEGNDTKNKTVYAPDLIHEKALDFIRTNKDKPFFCIYSRDTATCRTSGS